MYGPPPTADALLARFNDLGFRGEVRYPLSFAELRPIHQNSPLVLSFIVVALAVAAVIGAGVMLSARSYAVLRLQGKSFADVFLRDMRQLAVFWTLSAAAVATASLVFLWFYNRLAWFGLFASAAAGITAVLFSVAVLTHAAMLMVLGRSELPHALKGALPFRTATVSASLVRAPALLLALVIAMAVVSSGRDVLARQAAQEDYRAAGEAASVSVNGSLGDQESRMDTGLDRWIRQTDAVSIGLAVLDAAAVLIALAVLHRLLVKERPTEA